MGLRIVPCTRDEANAFVAQHHRHNKPVPGCKFTLAAADGDTVVGVVLVGRPVARGADDGWTLEVNRLCTDGSRNACSFLYGASKRAARALGYRKLITYTLVSEGGASLRASGFRCDGLVGPSSWSRPSRPRIDKHPLQERMRWEAML